MDLCNHLCFVGPTLCILIYWDPSKIIKGLVANFVQCWRDGFKAVFVMYIFRSFSFFPWWISLDLYFRSTILTNMIRHAIYFQRKMNMLKFIQKYSYIWTLFILNDVSSKIGNCDLTTKRAIMIIGFNNFIGNNRNWDNRF